MTADGLICVYVCVCVCMHVCMYACVCACIHRELKALGYAHTDIEVATSILGPDTARVCVCVCVCAHDSCQELALSRVIH